MGIVLVAWVNLEVCKLLHVECSEFDLFSVVCSYQQLIFRSFILIGRAINIENILYYGKIRELVSRR